MPLDSRHAITLDLMGGALPTPLTPMQVPQELERTKKSPGLAALYSLLLPGMGELYAGRLGWGRYFMAAEGVLWLTYATFEVYGNSLRDDARAFAAVHAGIDPSGKDDQFYVDIGNYVDVYAYNEGKLQERQILDLYRPEEGYYWRWTSDAARSHYRAQRISSAQMYNNQRFVVAAILVNHVASAINAARTVILQNRDIDDAIGELRVRADVLGGVLNPHGVSITVTRTF